MKLWVGIKIKEVLTTGEIFLEMERFSTYPAKARQKYNEILVFDSEKPSILGYNTNTRELYSLEEANSE